MQLTRKQIEHWIITNWKYKWWGMVECDRCPNSRNANGAPCDSCGMWDNLVETHRAKAEADAAKIKAEGKIKLAELKALFGDTIPIAVVSLIFGSPPEWTVGQVRDKIREIAGVTKADAAFDEFWSNLVGLTGMFPSENLKQQFKRQLKSAFIAGRESVEKENENG